MAKHGSRGRRGSTKGISQPPVMYPLVTRVPIRRADPLELSQEAAARMGYNSHLLSQAQIERLETVAGMNFKPDTRRKLQGIADNWLSHDLVLQSARPRDFVVAYRRWKVLRDGRLKSSISTPPVFQSSTVICSIG